MKNDDATMPPPCATRHRAVRAMAVAAFTMQSGAAVGRLRRSGGKVMRLLAPGVLPLCLMAADRPVMPYLQGQAMPDLMAILPPPPQKGDPREADDRATFRTTRSLAGTGRWQLATRDVTDDRFTVFACAIGRKLDASTAPALARIFARMGDNGMVGRAKDGFASRRPYLDQGGEICEPKTAHLAGNGDYPSGHTSNGWSTALVLAELMPDRATAILQRGRVYGESRFICGSHSRSAVEAGFMAGSVLVSRLHADEAFRGDMEAARRELVREKGTSSQLPQCRVAG